MSMNQIREHHFYKPKFIKSTYSKINLICRSNSSWWRFSPFTEVLAIAMVHKSQLSWGMQPMIWATFILNAIFEISALEGILFLFSLLKINTRFWDHHHGIPHERLWSLGNWRKFYFKILQFYVYCSSAHTDIWMQSSYICGTIRQLIRRGMSSIVYVGGEDI